MATALTTNFGYTYPGIVGTNVLFKPTEDTPAIADFCVIDQGTSYRKRYNLLTQLSKILKPYSGCERTFSGSKVITDMFLETKEFEIGLEFCKDDFTGQLSSSYNLMAQEFLKTGNESFDISGTPINTIITKLIDDAIRRDIFRRFSFGAQDSSSADWNTIDGLWTRLIDTSGGSNYCVRRTTGTALGTGALSADEAKDVLAASWLQASNLLKAIPKSSLTFWVTGSIYDNYLTSLQGTGAVTEQAIENIQKGITNLTYNGIKVKDVRIWDTELEDSTNPLSATTRHLVLLTAKENHIFGVESGADLNKVEGWYERKDRKYYFEGDMKFGYNYLHCDLQQIAY
jgi:hypothetical protein